MKNAALALLIPSGDAKSLGGKADAKAKGGDSKKLRLSTCKDILAAETPEELDAALSEWMGYYEADDGDEAE